jgi:hypothetical protein
MRDKMFAMHDGFSDAQSQFLAAAGRGGSRQVVL